MGFPEMPDVPPGKIVETMVENGVWCVGTPDDLIATINRLDEESGGFGGLLIQATEWANREQMMRSYELIARYVMPQFQGSLVSLANSQKWSAEKRVDLMSKRDQAIAAATAKFEKDQKQP